MDWFLVKKCFFDSWDNLLGQTLLNLGYIILIVGLILLGGPLSEVEETIQIGILASFLLLYCLYTIGVNSTTHCYSNYEAGLFEKFGEGIRKKIGHFPLLWILYIMAIIIPFIGVPYYLESGITGAFLICAALLFFEVYLILSMQYFCPLAYTFNEDSPIETLKKSFRLTAENFWFSLFVAFITAVKLVISIITLLFIPGLSGICLCHNNAVKLLLMRSSWMMEHNTLKKRKVDYRDLLEEERQCVGNRTLKDLLFPWKNISK